MKAWLDAAEVAVLVAIVVATFARAQGAWTRVLLPAVLVLSGVRLFFDDPPQPILGTATIAVSVLIVIADALRRRRGPPRGADA